MGNLLSSCFPPKEDPDVALLEAIRQARESEKERKVKLTNLRAKKEDELLEDERQFNEESIKGVSFIKHGRHGKPHARVISIRGKFIDWTTGNISFDEVTQIVSGKQCDVIRDLGELIAPSQLCFSIITPTRSLALQALTVEQKDKWITGLTRLWKHWQMVNNGDTLNKLNHNNNLLKNNDNERTENDDNSDDFNYDNFIQNAEVGITFVLHQKNKSASQKQVMINRITNEIVFVIGVISIIDVIDIFAGKQTDVFAGISDELSPHELCFSVITATKTLDLQAPDENTAHMWVKGLRRWWSTIAENEDKSLASAGVDQEDDSADPIKLLAKEHETDLKTKKLLEKGSQFLKYGNFGAPHTRNVFVDFGRKEVNYTSGAVSISDILEVVAGKNTSIFKGTNEKESPEILCFSIVGKKRTLDLQASTQNLRDQWVKGMQRIVELYKLNNLTTLNE